MTKLKLNIIPDNEKWCAIQGSNPRPHRCAKRCGRAIHEHQGAEVLGKKVFGDAASPSKLHQNLCSWASMS